MDVVSSCFDPLLQISTHLTHTFPDYAASKGGLGGMMRNLSAKLAPLNISVNDVAPALIGETGMLSSPDVIPGGVGIIPMGRLGSPQEVANVVTMLATTGFMTGQSLLIAGGLK
jgi:3-oxoacyl-[acyl-carrier protein] reductase